MTLSIQVWAEHALPRLPWKESTLHFLCAFLIPPLPRYSLCVSPITFQALEHSVQQIFTRGGGPRGLGQALALGIYIRGYLALILGWKGVTYSRF